MAISNSATETRSSRVTEEYLLAQVDGFRATDSHLQHKSRINKFDLLYDGNFASLFPGEAGLSETPLVENKVKNATHDLARLASEAYGSPVFMRQGEGIMDTAKANVRQAIAKTVWEMGGGEDQEMKLYIDLIATGYAALAVFYNDQSDYPQFLRLNPRNCYPDVVNGKLQTLLYSETVKERTAARMFPNLGLKNDAKNNNSCLITTLYTPEEVVMAVVTLKRGGNSTSSSAIVDRWEHDLGCVPVGFVALDSANDTFHGLFDQLGGPLMIRNKVVRLMTDYMESLAHSPFEEKGILNPTAEPGPTTIYHHDPTAEESFMRRVAPAASSGTIFGMLNYLGEQEASEAIQPPARVGIVQQSIASGSFVASTQGTLSSVVKELQKCCGRLRRQVNEVAFKIEHKYLDTRKPLVYAVGDKSTYKPSVDMGKFYYHKIEYGAAAGLNRSEADVRILQHLGARLISKRFARTQLDFIDDTSVQQDEIDREALADAFFQRFAGDPNTPMSIVARVLVEMGKGRSFLDVLDEIQPELFAAEQAAQQAATAGPGEAQAAAAAGQEPGAEQAALEAGGTGVQGQAVDFGATPLPQIITRNPTF